MKKMIGVLMLSVLFLTACRTPAPSNVWQAIDRFESQSFESAYDAVRWAWNYGMLVDIAHAFEVDVIELDSHNHRDMLGDFMQELADHGVEWISTEFDELIDGELLMRIVIQDK